MDKNQQAGGKSDVLLLTKLNSSVHFLSDELLHQVIDLHKKDLNFGPEHHLFFDKMYNVGNNKFMRLKTNKKTLKYMKEQSLYFSAKSQINLAHYTVITST